MKQGKIIGILLAAGLSSRAGTAKLLWKLGKKNILQSSVDNLLNSDTDKIIVVLGNKSNLMKKHIEKSKRIKIIVNENFAEGLSSSIKCGLNGIDDKIENIAGILLMLADKPFVKSETINKIIKKFRETDRGIVVPVFNRMNGHPVVISKEFINEIRTIKGDKGCSDILIKNNDKVFKMETSDKSILKDIDTEEDYRAFSGASKHIFRQLL